MLDFRFRETSKKDFVYFIVLIAALSGFLFGYDTGVISGAIVFINAEFHLSTLQTSFVVSSVLFGAFLSAMISGHFADSFGRRRLLFLNGLLFLIGSLLSACSSDTSWLITSRLIIGFALGISSYVTPLYISEISSFKHRGVMVGFNQLFIVIGILVSYVVDLFFTQGAQWRIMLGMGAFPAILLMLGLLLVPESPRWLLAHFQEDSARKILHFIRAPENNIERELIEIKQNIEAQRDDWHMLLRPWIRPAVIVGFGIAMFQQLVGINIFIYYAPTLFQYAGFHAASGAMQVTVGLGILLTLFTIVALFLIDRWGRRPLLILGTIGMTLSMFMLSGLFSIKYQGTLFQWCILGAAIIYVSSFAISFGPIAWLLIAEVFPLRIRGLASSLATATIWGFDLLVILTFLSLQEWFSLPGMFLFYGILCLLSLIFVYLMVPETKNVSLEHIEHNLRTGKSSRELGLEPDASNVQIHV
jgi:MFS transporter, SP family, galactose:H+ symporter